MKIGILGSGLMGSKLGTLWARECHEVTFSYSRSAQKLERLARECDGFHGSVSHAVDTSDVLLLSVHWSRIQDVLEQAGDLSGKVVLNCCVPLNEANSEIIVGTTTSGAEELARLRPKARWVSCFNTVPSEAFGPVYSRKSGSRRPQVLIHGDDTGAKDVAGGLIREIGFEPREAGPLRTARFAEPFAMITAELAYSQPGGPALTYRFDKLR
ncbi:NADPH-dependent F420 reductase [Roseovarius sp. MMSF_3281]|uniref:NADPH-dependent F420 reductase n=1 Tax=Roseovarius sp. MMSF_3281 TaxID=3046694 RepID=UPI00274018BA|nr:NAD(P)-binding domain-containing protein [Roseovarius sp. MMSF_3281]